MSIPQVGAKNIKHINLHKMLLYHFLGHILGNVGDHDSIGRFMFTFKFKQ